MKPNLYLSTSKRCELNSVYQSGFSSCSELLFFDEYLVYPAGNNIILDHINDTSRQIALKGHDNCISALGIDEKIGYLASGQIGSPGSKNYDSPVFLWNLQSKKKIGVFQGLKQGVKNLKISQGCRYLAGVSHKNQIIVWDIQSQYQIFARVLENKLTILNFQNDMMNIVNGKILQQLDLRPLLQSNKPPLFTNFSLPSSGFPRNYTCLAKAQDKVYLVGNQSGQICLFVKGVFKFAQVVAQGKVNSLLIHPNGTDLFIAIGKSVLYYQFNEGKLTQKQKIECGQVKKLTIAKQMLLGLTESGILSFHKKSLQNHQIRHSHSSRINGVASKNQIIVSIEEKGYVYIRYYKNNQAQLYGIYYPHKKAEGTCIQVGNSDNFLAGYGNGSIHSVSLDGKKMLWEISAHKGKVTSIYSNDICILSGGQDCVVRIWQQKSHQLINQLSVHQKAITRVLCDDKYPHIVHSCSSDRSLSAFDMKADKKLYFKQVSSGQLTGMDYIKTSGDIVICGPGLPPSFINSSEHQPYLQLESETKIMKLAVNSSGTIIALGDDVGNIFLFSLNNKNYLGMYEVHSREITGLAWVNERCLVTVSDDQILAILEL